MTEPTLRDRKRLRTRDTLERAAVDLVLRDGVEHATVDAICAAADVSSRTFFNYFDSKEHAILGMADAAPALRLGDDLVAGVVEVLFESVRSTSDPALQRGRIEIARRYPYLVERRLTEATRDARELSAAVTVRLGSAALTEPVLALCAAAIRTAIAERLAGSGDGSEEGLRDRATEIARAAAAALILPR